MTKSDLLIVDDSGCMHTLVRTCLEPDPFVIHSVYDGHAALSAAAELEPRLVLLDVGIPGPDGFEVCRRLKADPRTTNAAVMFLTADTSLHDKLKGLRMGAVDYITKPFTPEKLRARVRLAIRVQHRQERSVMIDCLTGLWNQIHLGEHLAAQLSWAARSGSPLACLTADVDPLARPDEHYGDVAGEEIVRVIANIFQSQCRGSDDTVYYCGDWRFAAILAGTNSAGAERVAKRVRQQIDQVLRRDDEEVFVRCSFGVADTEAQTDVPLLERAVAAAREARQFSDSSASADRLSGETSRAAA